MWPFRHPEWIRVSQAHYGCFVPPDFPVNFSSSTIVFSNCYPSHSCNSRQFPVAAFETCSQGDSSRINACWIGTLQEPGARSHGGNSISVPVSGCQSAGLGCGLILLTSKATVHEGEEWGWEPRKWKYHEAPSLSEIPLLLLTCSLCAWLVPRISKKLILIILVSFLIACIKESNSAYSIISSFGFNLHFPDE